MKISQEVRDFAFLNPPQNGEADHSARPNGGGGSAQEPEADITGAEMSNHDIDASFAQMSKRFHDEGGEIYLPTTE